MNAPHRVTLESLDAIAHEYHLNENVPDMFIENQCQQYCCDWLAGLVAADDDVLELGVGDGVTLSRLAQKKPRRYVMLEGSSTLAAMAARKHPSIEVVHGLFEDYSPSRPFSKVFALHVLEHVDDPVALLRAMHPWFAPGGELVVVVPNAESIHRQLAVMMGLQPALDTLSPRDHVVGHQRVYTLEGLHADLAAAGFEVVEEKGFFLKVVPNGMMLDWQPALIDALNKVGEQLAPRLLANIAVRARLAKA